MPEAARNVKLDSTVQCPQCGFRSKERMPTDYCLVRYECKECGYIMTPKKGMCCIFCSYGDVKCPPMQLSSSET
jgi:rubredoxin